MVSEKVADVKLTESKNALLSVAAVIIVSYMLQSKNGRIA
jgi:hypothetical protein